MVIFVCADCERVGAALAPLSVQQICKNSTFFLQMQDTFGKKKVFSLPSCVVERQDAAGRRKARQNTSRAMKKATKPAGSIPLVSWLVLLLEA